jgi:hypothetical protein
MLEQGTPAPGVELPAQDGTPVRLSGNGPGVPAPAE